MIATRILAKSTCGEKAKVVRELFALINTVPIFSHCKTCYLRSLFLMATCLVRPLQKYMSFTVTVLDCHLPFATLFFVCVRARSLYLIGCVCDCVSHQLWLDTGASSRELTKPYIEMLWTHKTTAKLESTSQWRTEQIITVVMANWCAHWHCNWNVGGLSPTQLILEWWILSCTLYPTLAQEVRNWVPALLEVIIL